MSASMRPTRLPRRESATDLLTATVVLPTPPLPEPIATIFETPGKATGEGMAWECAIVFDCSFEKLEITVQFVYSCAAMVANYVYGTGAVVPALIVAGVKPGRPAIRRAVAWLEAHQNPDGGWGEDLRSYDDPALAGRGASTASQTAWALLALLAAGPPGPAAHAGVRWLTEHQRPDGSWDEPQYTGTGFPGDFYINYHLYRLVFPLSAVARERGSAAR